ncbi:MAG: arginase family protein [Gammaproteobacteria bacterium]
MDKLHYATAANEDTAQVVIFGANSNRASHAPSHQTTTGVDRSLFSGDFARDAENESPSLSEKMVPGDHVYDAGNLSMPDKKLAQVKTMFNYFDNLFNDKKIPICLGGDHLVKYAGLSALFKHHPDAYVIYLDAHPDCHMTERLYYGSILHHVLNDKKANADQIVLTGLRQSNAKEKIGYEFYAMPTIFGIEFSLYTLKEIFERIQLIIPAGKHVYFSVDLDGFDPADTPGVEQPCPGGPKVNDFLALMHLMASKYYFAGMDITEFLPSIDKQKLTGLAMMRIVKEFAALSLNRTA